MVVAEGETTSGSKKSWEQMLWMVKERAKDRLDIQDMDYLESHPLDWLMTARFVRVQYETFIAEGKARLSSMEKLLPSGQPDPEYLLHRRRQSFVAERNIRFMGQLDEQIHHAKYLLGYDRIPFDTWADLMDDLVAVRVLLVDETKPLSDAVRVLNVLIHKYDPHDRV